MNKLFNGLEYVRSYIEDLLIISNKPFEDHINKLDKVLSKLNKKVFKVNAEKSFFARNKLEYLGFRITREIIILNYDLSQENYTLEYFLGENMNIRNYSCDSVTFQEK